MKKPSSNETFNYMKSKGRIYIFVIQPLLFSGVATIITIGFRYLFLWFDHGQSLANEFFVLAIKSGWSVIMFMFIGMYIILAILNTVRWMYYKNKVEAEKSHD